MVGFSKELSSRFAASMTSRTSETEELIALSSRYLAPECSPIIRAMLVFPLPGGPQRITDAQDDESPERNLEIAEPLASRCCCPISSDICCGLRRSARGVGTPRF